MCRMSKWLYYNKYKPEYTITHEHFSWNTMYMPSRLFENRLKRKRKKWNIRKQQQRRYWRKCSLAIAPIVYAMSVYSEYMRMFACIRCYAPYKFPSACSPVCMHVVVYCSNSYFYVCIWSKHIKYRNMWIRHTKYSGKNNENDSPQTNTNLS